MTQRVLITGCRGLIGKILWENLTDSFELYGLDRKAGVEGGNILYADVTMPQQTDAVFNRIPAITYVVHLAGVPRVDADWESAFAVNIGGTKNLYAAAQRHGVKRIVFASSNHVTGAYEGIPPSLHARYTQTLITTRDPIRPDGFYGVSKVAGEAIARMYFELYGLQSVCLRIGSVLKDDDPTRDPRTVSTWISHRDLIQLIRCSLMANVEFGIYYGVSNNTKRFWDISDAERDLGYYPQDDATNHLSN